MLDCHYRVSLSLKVHEVALETVAMGEASEERIISLLRSALTDGDKWVLVTNVHLASSDHCEQLRYHLQLLARNEGLLIHWLISRLNV